MHSSRAKALLDLLPLQMYLQLRRWDYKRTRGCRFAEQQRMRSVTTDEGYSYKPFDDKRSIFVHIPKCAGVSVAKALFGNLAGGHTTLDEYLDIFEPRCIMDYFKFTIVRNPWDRLVSAYFYLRDGGFGSTDRNFFERELSEFRGFDAFVHGWVNRSNIWRWYHFRPQYHFMLDRRERVALDFVAFFENLNDDFRYIANRMGLDCRLPKSNESTHSLYADHYDKQTRNIVADVYADDIRMLGYSFDNSSIEHQLEDRRSGKVYALHA